MRWEQLQAAQQAEAERWQHVREAGLKGKQNKSSEHYNIISLDYHPTREGQTLRLKVSCHCAQKGCHTTVYGPPALCTKHCRQVVPHMAQFWKLSRQHSTAVSSYPAQLTRPRRLSS